MESKLPAPAKIDKEIPEYVDEDEPGSEERKDRKQQELFLRGRKLQLIADRYPASHEDRKGGKWCESKEYEELTADEKTINAAVDHILNQVKTITKEKAKKEGLEVIRVPKRRMNGADDIVICPKSLFEVDLKRCEPLGRDWQFLLDNSGKKLQAKDLEALTFSDIQFRAADLRYKIRTGYFKRIKEEEEEDEYQCQCGREAKCDHCHKTFCTKYRGDHCYECRSGVCDQCTKKGRKMECTCD
jgi:hypothetical protein